MQRPTHFDVRFDQCSERPRLGESADPDDPSSIEAKLEDTSFSPTSFLSSEAKKFNLTPSVTERGTSDASDTALIDAVELEIEVQLSGAEHDSVLEYLSAIENSTAPIYIKQLTMRKTSKRSTSADSTPLEVTMVVSSFRLGGEEFESF